jgi:hypothetical protein
VQGPGEKSEAQRKNKREISDFHQKIKGHLKASALFQIDETPKREMKPAVISAVMHHAEI